MIIILTAGSLSLDATWPIQVTEKPFYMSSVLNMVIPALQDASGSLELSPVTKDTDTHSFLKVEVFRAL